MFITHTQFCGSQISQEYVHVYHLFIFDSVESNPFICLSAFTTSCYCSNHLK